MPIITIDPALVQRTVPQTVTKAQARVALRRADLLASVEQAVAAADDETQIWYADALTWRRDAVPVVALGAALGLTSQQIDGLFAAAAAIDV
jgi:hypothetical protein